MARSVLTARNLRNLVTALGDDVCSQSTRLRSDLLLPTPTKKERNEMTKKREATLYDFFDADTDENVLRAFTMSEARFVLGDAFATTTYSLAAGLYEEMPAEAFTNRISNRGR